MWVALVKKLIGWTIASKWMRAAKCRSLVLQVQHRLVIQKNRRESIVRQSRSDIAQLIQTAQFHQALAKVGHLYKDQSLLSVYDQISKLCECIITNLSIVSRRRSLDVLPDDVKEAVSSLIFAASRCGELLELHLLRNFFRQCYGSEIETVNVKLLPGNLVNSEMRLNLCIKHVADEDKLALLQEIGKEFTLYIEFQEPGTQLNLQLSEKCNLEGQVELRDIEIETGSSDGKERSNTQKGGRSLKSRGYEDQLRQSTRWSHCSKYHGKHGHRANLIAGKHDNQDNNSTRLNHVHPKLPDYENVVAKLKHLKREYKRKKKLTI